MTDASLIEIATTADWVLSVLPPSEARGFAEKFTNATTSGVRKGSVFVDCNAVNPTTAKQIYHDFFKGTEVKFIDASIIGGPPKDSYDPMIYASAEAKDEEILARFEGLNEWGLKIKSLRGEEGGVGDASALKMSYAGITKGLIGLCTTMILSAHASSPATSSALLSELSISQPVILNRIIGSTLGMLPKAYRWVGEMEEISEFVKDGLGAGGEEHVHEGFAKLYERVEKSLSEEGGEGDEVKVLRKFVEDAKKVVGKKQELS